MAARRPRHHRQRRRKPATLAASADPARTVYLVPAFAGLGAPHWDSEARAAIFGLTRGATRKEIVRAALESVGYQTRDLIDAMRADAGSAGDSVVIRVDGGMSAERLDDAVPRRHGSTRRSTAPTIFETTALGAGYLAGWQAGLYPGPKFFAERDVRTASYARRWTRRPAQALYRGWRAAVERAL